MGNFYVSFAVRDAEQDAVAAALKKHGRQVFVSPQQDSFVYFYDAQADEQDVEVIEQLGASISGDLQTAILTTLNHDDDVFMYWLFDRGELVDTYNSFPGYFDSDDDDETEGVLPKGGDAAKLVKTLGANTSAKKVHEVLRADNETEDYVFAVDRHIALANLLGLRAEHCYLGYGYVAEGDASDIVDRDRFVEVK